MKTFFIIIVFLACYKIISSKGTNRFLWLTGSLIFLSDNIRISGPFNSHFFFALSYIVSLYKNDELKTTYKIYPLKQISLIIFILYILIGILDERIQLVSKFSRPITEFMLSYMSFFIGFASIRNSSDFKLVLNAISKMFYIVCLYGITTYVIQNNPWYDLITTTFSDSGTAGIWSEAQSRGYRVCSFLSNPIVYGGVVGLISLIVHTTWHPRISTTKYILFILLLLNVLLANSRTGVFTTLLGFIVYYILKNKLSMKNMFVFMVSICSFIIIYNTIDFLRPTIDSAIDLVTNNGANTEGSNIDLKEQQWTTSLIYFNKAPFFGNGFSYFGEVIGNKESLLYNMDIAGMEGYQYELLIENGIFMIIASIAFFIMIIICFFKNRKNKLSYVGISCVSIFLFFICSTGTYGSIFLHCGIYIGLLLRQVYDKTILNSNTCI